jgi:hypothetical protein
MTLPPNNALKFSQRRPIANQYLVAVFIAIFVGIHSIFWLETPELTLIKVGFAVALVLLNLDQLSACFACIPYTGGKKWRNPYLWLAAYQMGYFWCVLMVIINLTGPKSLSSQFLIYGILGIAFGSVLVWISKPSQQEPAESWNFTAFETQKTWFKVMPFVFPLVLICLLVFNLADLRSGKTDMIYIMFIAVFMSSLVRPIHRASYGNSFSKDSLIKNGPLLLGCLITIAVNYLN